MKSFRCLFILAALSAGQMAIAGDECRQYNTSYDKTYCMAKLFLEADKELNVVYKDLQATIKGDIKKALTETLREWIKYRDQSCEKRGAINVGCNFEVNRNRTEYMRDRLRECRAGTCRTELVTKKSWE